MIPKVAEADERMAEAERIKTKYVAENTNLIKEMGITMDED
jgi:hypothetical protein